MNKPAQKEPSMDEILSSIRQIIADDDAQAVSAPKSAPESAEARSQAAEAVNVNDAMNVNPAGPEDPAGVAAPAQGAMAESQPQEDAQPEEAQPAEPLALSPEQIVHDEVAAATGTDWAAAEPEEPAMGSFELDEETAVEDAGSDEPLVDPDDLTFEGASEDDEPAEPHAAEEEAAGPDASGATTGAGSEGGTTEGAPMPDPDLSADMAEELLEPATTAAVQHTFSRLNEMQLANRGPTLDEMVRDMLRPMLKEWLDENLPSVVERMVEREISRISRGN